MKRNYVFFMSRVVSFKEQTNYQLRVCKGIECRPLVHCMDVQRMEKFPSEVRFEMGKWNSLVDKPSGLQSHHRLRILRHPDRCPRPQLIVPNAADCYCRDSVVFPLQMPTSTNEPAQKGFFNYFKDKTNWEKKEIQRDKQIERQTDI